MKKCYIYFVKAALCVGFLLIRHASKITCIPVSRGRGGAMSIFRGGLLEVGILEIVCIERETCILCIERITPPPWTSPKLIRATSFSLLLESWYLWSRGQTQMSFVFKEGCHLQTMNIKFGNRKRVPCGSPLAVQTD